MEPKEVRGTLLGPQTFDLGIPLGGVDLSQPGRDITHLHGTGSNAIRVRGGVICPAHGRTKVGSQLTGGVQCVTHIRKYTGLAQALACTEDILYKWSAGDWVAVQETYTTGTVTVSADPTVTGSGTSWTDHIHAGDDFHVTGDGPHYTVDSVTDNTHLELTESYAGTPAGGKAYTTTRLLQGDVASPFTYAFGQNNWLFSNQLDWVKKYNGTTLATLLGASGYQTKDFHRAKAIRYFDDSVILLAPEEDGTVVWQRIRWSDIGTLEDWTSTNFHDLVDSPGVIVNGLSLGNIFAIYKRDSIIYMAAVGGTWGFAFTDEQMGIGLSAPNTLIHLGDAHFFLGEASGIGYNVFLNVGQRIIPIGDPIKEHLQEYLSRENIGKCWAMWNPLARAILLFTPTIGNATPNKVWIYELRQNTMTEGRWWMDNITTTCGGIALQSAAVTYGELVGTYGDQDWFYGTASLAPEAEIGHFGNTSGDVMKIDVTSKKDEEGVAIAQSFESKHFNWRDIGALPRSKVRCTGIEFIARGGAITVSYSTNEGRTWTVLDEITLTSQVDRYQAFFDVTADSVTVKFSNANVSGKFYLERWFIYLKQRSSR